MIFKLLKIYKLIEPLLAKKIPMFNQDIQSFGTSKTNWTGAAMIAAACFLLYADVESVLGII